ncbi:MAG: orotidine 5'-phosphate decarboxylase / HUMPS family protein, partial [candidate division WOR-3 bacterium]
GAEAIKKIKKWYEERIWWQKLELIPYVVADLKMMDRGETEVEIAAAAGADAAVALGHSPIESLNVFIQKCEDLGLDAMVDMINVENPLLILRQLKKLPRVVILHRGVDEERFNKEKQIPLHEIRRIKGNYNVLIAIAGGDTLKEVQQAIFNDADIVVIWKSVFQSTAHTAKLVEEFLKEIK